MKSCNMDDNYVINTLPDVKLHVDSISAIRCGSSRLWEPELSYKVRTVHKQLALSKALSTTPLKP